MRIHICNGSAGVMDEVEAAMFGCLRRLGHEVTSEAGLLLIEDDCINITLCMFRDPRAHAALIANHIIFNFEQIASTQSTVFVLPDYLKLMRNAFVWDYSKDHCDELQRAGITRCYHVPLGFCNEFDQQPAYAIDWRDKDIDVLFYGTLTPRRNKVIEALRQRGIDVKAIGFGNECWDVERQAYIRRSKVLLNIGAFEDAHTLEVVRLMPWWSAGCAVVSELREDSSRDERFDGAYLAAPYDDLVQACLSLLSDEAAGRRLGQRAAQICRLTSFEDSLAAGLAAFADCQKARPGLRVRSEGASPPQRIRVMRNKEDWSHRFVCLSPNEMDEPDLVLDPTVMQNPIHGPHDSWRFGEIYVLPSSLMRVELNRWIEKERHIATLLDRFSALIASDGELVLRIGDIGSGATIDQKHAGELSKWISKANFHGERFHASFVQCETDSRGVGGYTECTIKRLALLRTN
jgi:hypothetical protein